jgi:hypothetical protein
MEPMIGKNTFRLNHDTVKTALQEYLRKHHMSADPLSLSVISVSPVVETTRYAGTPAVMEYDVVVETVALAVGSAPIVQTVGSGG